MKIEQIYTGCLAHGAYYIESNGEAAIIDPLREVDPYIRQAENDGAKIRYVFETHFHADFVSGHLDLAAKTGAEIIYGPGAIPGFRATVAQDNQEFRLGNASIKVLHTPGHTLESSCYLLRDEQGKDAAIFTGDTLFIGDVGRPDLAQKAAHKTKEELAGILYDSLRCKIMPLADDIIVYPGHGAGSACGKNMSRETTDTLGHQKATNYALDANLSRAGFIQAAIAGLTPPPAYFPLNAKLNKQGYDSLDLVLQRGLHALSPHTFEALARETNALILDTRDPQAFAGGFIPGSINIGIDGSFAPWAGALIPDVRQELLIVAYKDRETEVITRLARVGLDYCFGYLSGGIEAWKATRKPLETIPSIDAPALDSMMKQGDIALIDVRRQAEFDSGHLEGAVNIPLDYINENLAALDKDKTCCVYCAGGYRSMIFISILHARGYRNLIDVKGGFGALKAHGMFRITRPDTGHPVCQ
jgi:glyoxylase-like metal-dependent hydrolase (beta-lactamase superfamily II)/rhodanese-related sulfurtransferase